MSKIKTKIVDTKVYSNKFLILGFGVLYLAATFYIFLLEDQYPNKYLSIISFAIYIYGLYFMFRTQLLKPKVVGSLKITEKLMDFNYDETRKKLDFSDIKYLKLLYSGYANWTQNVWGNKNYLEIQNIDGEVFKFEFLIENKIQKDKLKKIFKSQSIKDKFNIEHLSAYNQQQF